ncbi:DNA-directed RNA polymerase sigma-70 factor [Iodidimonas gelatinilytica]|uniref:DNA-directed RNA polymerase sigma-70 factor n=1 Tax=Iodidimonas gelatinilytica TaxID=1236966 RepID=A0A5A7MXQ9_9PROT|nr:RNA polymerase sigma factor [Iodidimonas gelatinilytica]GER00823.1 DNA-directed RNA polymerase sigma-70 factor [Iodidimonas gelatinilytica]
MQSDKERLLDDYLVTAARIGDRRALDHLVTRWSPRFLRHAYRLLGDESMAQDMAQEAWEQILRGLARLEDARAFPAWAYRIVTRRCARAIRQLEKRRNGQKALAADPTPLACEAADNEPADSARRADMALVLAALKTLPGPQRAALALFYMEDLSISEIAIVLEIPVGTVKTRLMHGRLKIRDIVKGTGDDQIG